MILADEGSTMRVGASLARQLRAGDVVLLSGGLGAGKTTLVRGLLAALGHGGEVPSPSFAIVQPYEDLDPPIWHADLYRIDDPGELDELGIDDFDGALVVEWPERAAHDAWPNALRLALDVDADGVRRLTAKAPAAWEGRWPLP
jgi:tRNA threonylcarbamoyladenosine biosynthesis protein TsaE